MSRSTSTNSVMSAEQPLPLFPGAPRASSAIQMETWTPRQPAVTKPADASYDTVRDKPLVTPMEQTIASRVLGREARGDTAYAVTCAWGLPAVLRVGPQLPNGTPFPTTFWMSCPLAHSKISALEGEGVMKDMTAELQADPERLAVHEAQGKRYVEFRNSLGPRVPTDPAAGGMPDRIKCLHALYGHHLATGDNETGAWVAEQIEPFACPKPCVDLPEDFEVPPAPRYVKAPFRRMDA